ncbi:MAG: CPXCG motif-containing cysteine-rich protein [Steroidobacteraceae bacterium]
MDPQDHRSARRCLRGAMVGDSFAAMNLLQGHDATCPHCWETINLTLDLSVPEQSYIEDCPVCCKPMLVSYSTTDGEVDALSVDSAS